MIYQRMMRYGLFGSAFGMTSGFGVRIREMSRNRAISIACYARNKNPMPKEARLARRERIERELDELSRLVDALR
ncbi:MAG: hypothetical protein AB7F76_00820 [Parvibaculaceae bacterium]